MSEQSKTPKFDELMATLDKATNNTLVPAHKMLIKDMVIGFAAACEMDSVFRNELFELMKLPANSNYRG